MSHTYAERKEADGAPRQTAAAKERPLSDQHLDALRRGAEGPTAADMGHRIELGEIEAIVQLQDGIRSAACVFDDERKRIILCYTGDVELKAVAAELKTQLPRYMQPNAIKQLDRMPLTANGKIDRALLKSTYATAKRAR